MLSLEFLQLSISSTVMWLVWQQWLAWNKKDNNYFDISTHLTLNLVISWLIIGHKNDDAKIHAWIWICCFSNLKQPIFNKNTAKISSTLYYNNTYSHTKKNTLKKIINFFTITHQTCKLKLYLFTVVAIKPTSKLKKQNIATINTKWQITGLTYFHLFSFHFPHGRKYLSNSTFFG